MNRSITPLLLLIASSSQALAQAPVLLTASSGNWSSDAGTFEACLQAAGGDGGNVALATGASEMAGDGASGDYGCAIVTAPVGTSFSFTNDAKSAAANSASGGNGNAGGNTTFAANPSGAPAISLSVTGGAGGIGVAGNGGVPGFGTPTHHRVYFPITTNVLPADVNLAVGRTPGPHTYVAPGSPQPGNGAPGGGYGGAGAGAYATSAMPGPYVGGQGSPGAIVIYR